MSHKRDLLAAMGTARAELEQIVAAHGDRLTAAHDQGWRLHDVVAHIAVWERVATRKITGAPLPEGKELASMQPWDLDAFNDATVERWRPRSAAEVLTEFAAAHLALVAAVEGASEDDCAPGGKVWQAIDDDGAGHYHVHFPVADHMAERWPRETGTD